MLTGLLPPIVLQLLLFSILFGVFLFVIRAVAVSLQKKRSQSAAHTLAETDAAAVAEFLPRLSTPQRVTASTLRLVSAPAGMALPTQVEIGFVKRRIVFTPSDFAEPGVPERYASVAQTTGGNIDLALFALCSLDEGGAEAIRTQIKDYDKIDDPQNLVRLVPTQTQPGDYVVIGRVLSHRKDSVGADLPVIVYRAEVIKSDSLLLVIELAVPDDGQTPFADDVMVHGTARLYGYLP